jgi:hypothetical protein
VNVELPAVNATEINNPKDPTGKNTTMEASAGVQTYSERQLLQVSRIAPIKYCSNPEFYLDEAIDEYCPQHVLESDDAYTDRSTRAKSAFEPFYSYFRNFIVGTALRKGAQTPEDGIWSDFFANVDLEYTSLNSFLKKSFSAAIDGGVAGLWVDYPIVKGDLSSKQEKDMGLRPYWVIIKCDDILEIRHDIFPIKFSDGRVVLGRFPTYLRLKAEYEGASSNDNYVTRYPAAREYRLVEAKLENGEASRQVEWKLFALLKDSDGNNKDDYEEVENGTIKKPFISYVPCYGGEIEAYNEARPELLDIARLNLHYWACAADVANIIHNTGFDIKWASGVNEEDAQKLSSDRMLIAPNVDAKFGVLSSQMNGVDSALENLARIEKSIEKLAAVTLNAGNKQAESGYAKLLDRSQSDSQIAVLVQHLEDSLNLLISYTAEWMLEGNPVKITISKDFVPVKMHSQQVMALLSLWEKAPIPVKLLFETLEAGMVFEGIPGFSVEKMLETLKLDGSETSMKLGYGAAGLAAKVEAETGAKVKAEAGSEPESSENSEETPESEDRAAAA